jgi:hypothetical protein
MTKNEMQLRMQAKQMAMEAKKFQRYSVKERNRAK